MFGLSNGEGLTMTVAQYVTPRGTIIQSKGDPPRLLPITSPSSFHFISQTSLLSTILSPTQSQSNFNLVQIQTYVLPTVCPVK